MLYENNKAKARRKSIVSIPRKEKGDWISIPDFEGEKKRYEEIARRTLAKTKRVNLRLNEQDFEAAHLKAREEGIPYQTLLASVIHKYLRGRLVERS